MAAFAEGYLFKLDARFENSGYSIVTSSPVFPYAQHKLVWHEGHTGQCA